MPLLSRLSLLLLFAFCGGTTGRRPIPTAAGGSLILAAINSIPQHPIHPSQQQQQQQQEQEQEQQQQLARPLFAPFRSKRTLLHCFNSSSSRESASSSSKSCIKGPESKEAQGEKSSRTRGGLCPQLLTPNAGALLLLLLLLLPLRRCWLGESKAIHKEHTSSSSSSSAMEEAEPSVSARAFALRHLMLRAAAPTARKPPPDWAPVVFRLEGLPVGLRARQSPGDGNCLFVSVAAALWIVSFESHASFHSQELRDAAVSLRTLAVDTLEDAPVKSFVMEGSEWVGRQQLLQLVAQQYCCEPAVYCSRMRMQTTWGGGPEILALAHALGRPIAVYTLQGGCRSQAAGAAAPAPDPMQQTLLRLLQQPRSDPQQQQQQQQQRQQREAEVRLCKVFGWREGCKEEPLHLLFVNARDLEGLQPPRGGANHFVPLHPQPPP
ncbi:hypothetical protein Esti_003539 [Eimeria stiedai]